jgi:site-specific DNA-methyltransferase (adenine-specific)
MATKSAQVAKLKAGSASRTLARGTVQKLQKLVYLFQIERDAKLKQGDILIQLIDVHHLRPIEIAGIVQTRRSDISQMYHTSKVFPPGQRRPEIPYNHYMLAMRMAGKFPTLNMAPARILEEIRRVGLTQHRQVTAHFAGILRRQQMLLLDGHLALGRAGDSSCFYGRFQDRLPNLSDHSIKVIMADPPYASYRGKGAGRYAGGNVRCMDGHNQVADDAITNTVDLLQLALPKLAVGGVLLLWQHSGPLLRPITTAVDQYGWAVDTVVIWDKKNVQPGNFKHPYSTCCEWLWVLKRLGDDLLNHDNSSRSDIVNIPPMARPKIISQIAHAFEKPVELCRFLISKHSYAGEMVLEPFGGTGTACFAAQELGRRWLYCECHAGNFELGQQRLASQVRIAG